jgi:hypothetical protein
MSYTCPVCMYAEMPYPPADYDICPCCGTEFGNDDADLSNEQLRERWIRCGARWFFGNPPLGWNPWMQLIQAGLVMSVPSFHTEFRSQSEAISEPSEIKLREEVYSLSAVA